MVLALNPGPQFTAITGNPAGLLFWRIWYSVGKSGVLGITEYRQGRPLVFKMELFANSIKHLCLLLLVTGRNILKIYIVTSYGLIYFGGLTC